jgi:hypothetical protein
MLRPISILRAAIVGVVLAAAMPAHAQVSPKGPDPLASSREVSGLIAARDAESGAELSGRLMGGPSNQEKMKPIMRQMSDYGPSQYVDRVYARAIGTSSYDIIDKINFDRAIIFVRYLFHVERGEWQLTNFTFKTETNLPLPRDWVQIFPDGLVSPKP